MFKNDKYVDIWKEVVIICLKVSVQQSSAETQKNHEQYVITYSEILHHLLHGESEKSTKYIDKDNCCLKRLSFPAYKGHNVNCNTILLNINLNFITNEAPETESRRYKH
jgi:hypothetical protein